MKKVCAGFLLFLLFFSGWGASARGDEAGEMVQKVLKAYGGTRSLKKVRIFRETGTLTSTMRRGKRGSFTRLFKRPDVLRVRISFPGERTETRDLEGSRGMRQGKRVIGPPLDAMVLQAARMELPWILARKRTNVSITTGGSGQERVRVLKVDLGSGMVLYAHVDTRDWLIRRSRGVIPTKRGDVVFETEYKDFRPVKGVIFPFREVNYASGFKTADTVIERIEVLRVVPES